MAKNDKLDKVLSRGVSEILPSRQELREILEKRKITLYQGFDPSSPSLHIGHLIGIRKLAQFQELGHKVIFLIGDFTGMIGDPTDKRAARKRMTKKEVEENAKDYKKQVENIIDFEGDNAAEIKYNSKWLSELDMEDVVELSSNFTVQQFLERDMFRRRLAKNKPIYLHEFLYPLMQGYDSVAMGVDLEIGGNDQLFNMLAGRALAKGLKDKEKFVLTMKLLTGSDNQKMGKTKGNTVNLTDKSKDMYGKLMSLPDSAIKPGIELLTELEVSTIDEKEPMDAKKLLAFEVVKQVKGKDKAKKAKEHFEETFQKGKLPEDPEEIVLPGGKISLFEAIAKAGLTDSKSQAKRLIKQGAVEVEKKKVKDPAAEIELDNEGLIIRVGKTRFAKLVKK